MLHHPHPPAPLDVIFKRSFGVEMSLMVTLLPTLILYKTWKRDNGTTWLCFIFFLFCVSHCRRNATGDRIWTETEKKGYSVYTEILIRYIAVLYKADLCLWLCFLSNLFYSIFASLKLMGCTLEFESSVCDFLSSCGPWRLRPASRSDSHVTPTLYPFYLASFI